MNLVPAPTVETSETDGFIAWAIGESLLKESDVQRARRLMERTDDPFCLVLSRLGVVSEAALAEILARFTNQPLQSPSAYPDLPVLQDKLSPGFLRRSRVLPIDETETSVTIVAADPFDDYTRQAIGTATDRTVEVRIGTPTDIERTLERLYAEEPVESADQTDDSTASTGHEDLDLQRLRDLAADEPTIRFVNRLIAEAVDLRASDIHVEPFEGRVQVRYRIDGVMQAMPEPDAGRFAAIVSRIKLMAHLNIAERRLPQDGRIQLTVRGRSVDIRVSTLPSVYGESVALRLLDKESQTFDLDVLGFGEECQRKYLEILDIPTGVLLVTGPTGSGKTTTLYASLQRLNSPERKILTVEDPVEYKLDGVVQVQVQPQIDLTFANALRSLVRQDPDVILIGEIRDLETAEIAAHSALTGHKVFSTLHTNDAASSVTRLLDMGLAAFLVTSTVNGVVAQRLVRILCQHCRRPTIPSAEIQERLDRLQLSTDARGLYEAVGCAHCAHTGYRGRTSINEIMVVDDELRRLVLDHAEAREIHRAAVAGGMIPMFEDGLRKAAAGVTAYEEVLRVTREV
ncbi:MAG: Flp pilus assembly complex ATPase component [bacterium]|nr:Flp pilus assembly complex ATPase component [bacterium]